jgi:putative endonuclease
MQNNRELGKLGEDIAEKYISKQGYTIMQRNFRTKIGEIDIVAKDGKYIVFIEVKARRSISYGYPREAVDKNKQLKIREVASIYLMKNKKYDSQVRFDVVEVMLDTKNDLKSIVLLKNAF